MRIAGFAVQNYRSILKTPRIDLGDVTVVVGPNNEGKSNLLRALALGGQILARVMIGRSGDLLESSRSRLTDFYNWHDDYPKSLQRDHDGATVIDYWLTDEESHIEGSRRSDYIGPGTPLTWVGELHVRVILQGRRGKVEIHADGLPEKLDGLQMRRLFQRHLEVEYIAATRTADDATRVIRDLVARDFQRVLRRAEYRDLTLRLTEALSRSLAPVSEALSTTMKSFLPEVESARIEFSPDDFLNGIVDTLRVMVNDGVETDLQDKGHGMQSLAALSAARTPARATSRRREEGLVLVIEEPEAHLHPKAVHGLRQVVNDIAAAGWAGSQVIVSTHSPLLIDRFHISKNVIVHANEAHPAKTLSELREVLGVRASDNLASANLVLVVEGENDSLALGALIAEHHPELARHLSSGSLAIEYLRGASNLLPKLDALRQQLCKYHVFLDHDQAGREAGSRAKDAGLLAMQEETYAIVRSMRESEFEDLIPAKLYKTEIEGCFGISLDVDEFKKGRAKWSTRLDDAFRRQGKIFDKDAELIAKGIVARAVASNPKNALHPQRATSLEALFQALEKRISNDPSSP
ncbi:AAA family ATPase [Streptomyces sp. NPDC028635]|uniref:ATP-dependent nuclease n=1 Tax=Streptomyces sp. NPDC028635 TaxID=3154800 RepID=UPI00340BF6E0